MINKDVQYPFLQASFNEQGIILTSYLSAFKTETLIIPVANADAIAMSWLAHRPRDVFKQALQVREEAQSHKMILDRAVKESLRA